MYLLDTNILSEIDKRRPDSNVVQRFASTPGVELFTSAVCLEEIHFGIEAVPDGELVRQRMESKVLHRVTVLDFTGKTAKLAGELRGEWKRKGTPVG